MRVCRRVSAPNPAQLIMTRFLRAGPCATKRTTRAGQAHPALALSHFALGQALTKVQRFGRAAAAFDVALSIFQQISGNSEALPGEACTAHPDVARCHDALRGVRAKLGEHAAAEQHEHAGKVMWARLELPGRDRERLNTAQHVHPVGLTGPTSSAGQADPNEVDGSASALASSPTEQAAAPQHWRAQPASRSVVPPPPLPAGARSCAVDRCPRAIPAAPGDDCV